VFKNIEEPIMMTNGNEKWIVVLDEPKNKKLFEEQWSDTKLDSEWKVYFKPHDEFWRSTKIEIKRAEEKTRLKREREIKTPTIDEDIKRINSKESLVDYLLKEYYYNSEILIDEFSTDAEVSEAKLKANYNELLKLKDKYIGG